MTPPADAERHKTTACRAKLFATVSGSLAVYLELPRCARAAVRTWHHRLLCGCDSLGTAVRCRLLPTHGSLQSLADLPVRFWEVWWCGRGTAEVCVSLLNDTKGGLRSRTSGVVDGHPPAPLLFLRCRARATAGMVCPMCTDRPSDACIPALTQGACEVRGGGP